MSRCPPRSGGAGSDRASVLAVSGSDHGAVFGGHVRELAQQARGAGDEHLLLQLCAAVQLHVERLVEQPGGGAQVVCSRDAVALFTRTDSTSTSVSEAVGHWAPA